MNQPSDALNPQITPLPENISAEQKASLRGLYAKTGGYSKEALDAAFGASPDIPAAPKPAMSLGEANRELRMNNGHVQAAGATPADYQFRLDTSAMQTLELDVGEASKLKETFATALHAGTVPKSAASTIVREMMQAAAQLKTMSAEQRRAFTESEMAALKRLPNFGSLQVHYQYAYQKLPQSFRDYADKLGFFESASSALALAHVGELMVRRDRAGK